MVKAVSILSLLSQLAINVPTLPWVYMGFEAGAM